MLFGSVKGIDVYYVDLLFSLHYFICVAGMYSVARGFHMPPMAAIGSALVFTFAGILARRGSCEVHIFYGLALLPGVVYLLGKYYWSQRRKKYFVFAGLVAGCQILAGHIQPFFHTLFIGFILIVFTNTSVERTGIYFFYPVLSIFLLYYCLPLLLHFRKCTMLLNI